MAITHPALARAMARDLARAAPPEAGIKRIWVWSQPGYVDPERDYVELAVRYHPRNNDAEREFSLALAGLHDLYPEVNISAHTFTVCDLGDLDPAGELRPGSEEVYLSDE
jgi:hypothetical protein